jgi:putative ABC transport system permease protein
VVGVVADTKVGSRDEPSDDQFYIPAEQPAILFGVNASDALTDPAGGYITLRSALPPEEMTQTLRSTIDQIDPLLALHIQPMNEVIANIEAPRRFNTDLITAFAAGALLLAMTGIYAVVAFSVSLRVQEIAIRMTLGARARQHRTARAPIGRKAGAPGMRSRCARRAGRVATGQFISVRSQRHRSPHLRGRGLIMMGMTLLASTLPATRAASADPMQTLRST